MASCWHLHVHHSFYVVARVYIQCLGESWHDSSARQQHASAHLCAQLDTIAVFPNVAKNTYGNAIGKLHRNPRYVAGRRLWEPRAEFQLGMAW